MLEGPYEPAGHRRASSGKVSVTYALAAIAAALVVSVGLWQLHLMPHAHTHDPSADFVPLSSSEERAVVSAFCQASKQNPGAPKETILPRAREIYSSMSDDSPERVNEVMALEYGLLLQGALSLDNCPSGSANPSPTSSLPRRPSTIPVHYVPRAATHRRGV